MKVRKQVKQRAGAGRDVRRLIDAALAESERWLEEGRQYQKIAASRMEALASCRRELVQATDQILDARACLGADFVGLWPQLIESECISLDEMAQADGLAVTVDRLKPLLVKVERDLAGQRHIRARLANKETAYCVSKGTIENTNRDVLAKNIAREIARHLVEQL